MNRLVLVLIAGAAMIFSAGCSTKKYVRNQNPRPVWREYDLNELNAQIMVGKENYFLSWDGHLMPAKKDQPPPDLRYFKQTSK